MKYTVNINVSGRFSVDVEASNPEEAKELAGNAAFEADFGSLECIDWDIAEVEDENGDTIDSNDNEEDDE